MTNYELDKYKHDKEIKEKAEAALTALIDCTNAMGSEQAVIDGMWDALRKNHPTLQQSFVRALVGLGKVVEDKGYVGDDRNRNALKILKELGKNETALPFI